ncbi:phosphoglycerate kinase [Musa troglodytarum]|uniref:Phosphoglycerate kinase n=1 Tax=Musa troglodytarum TaxID=320322 RepID=A0A9E7KXA6_9LILI|nr:phosphoglycerate kinase [Musa troglodytarum]
MLVSSPCRNVLKKMGFEQTEPALQRVRGDVDWAGQTHSQQEPNGQEVIKKPFNIQRTARWNFCRKENSPRNLFKEENAQEFTKKTIQRIHATLFRGHRVVGGLISYQAAGDLPVHGSNLFARKCWILVIHVDKDSNIVRLDSVLPVQTLRNFPIEKLYGEVVMVRLDSGLLLNLRDSDDLSLNRALLTINYLYNAGAKVILVSNWLQSNASRLLSKEAFADHLSALLKVKVVPANDASAIMQFKMKNVENADVLLLDNLTNDKEEVANSYEFSKTLSSGVSIFVNDAFSLSHRVLASTVGVARFCHASVAGFHFEEELLQLMKISETKKQPYVAIIGGSNFLKKANTLHILASTCDGLIFIGKLAFQIMNGLGLSVPAHLVEHDAVKKALELIKLTHRRKIPIYFQKDFLCVKVGKPELLEIYTYNEILAGWMPVDLGPVSMKETSSMLSTCKKVILIGSVSFGSLEEDNVKTSQLASVLERISKNGSEVILIGNAACKAFAGKSSYSNQYSVFRNASVAWEFLKGTKLPGVAALDKAFQYNLNWDTIFADPTKPIAVDIGSGNGLFILKVARKCTDLNFLGLEINRKCPNPDFNREDQRWRMVQRGLVEAIMDLLITNGKVFLQSDIETVTTRMKHLFITYGKGKLVVDGDARDWMEENPFGVRTDWEQHVIERGAPMYRIVLKKV